MTKQFTVIYSATLPTGFNTGVKRQLFSTNYDTALVVHGHDKAIATLWERGVMDRMLKPLAEFTTMSSRVRQSRGFLDLSPTRSKPMLPRMLLLLSILETFVPK